MTELNEAVERLETCLETVDPHLSTFHRDDIRAVLEWVYDLESRLEAYLCDSTGSMLSKPGYDVSTMVRYTEEYYEKVHAEERAEVEKDLAEVEKHLDEAEQERDQALAVIERAKAAIGGVNEWDGHGRADQLDNTRAILNTAPVDALRERDAEKWDEGFDAHDQDWAHHDKAGWGDEDCIDATYNPYRREGE